jgi:hypothetical protein
MDSLSSTPDANTRRRSSRLAMRLKVVVSGVNSQSQSFEEKTETLEVSKYGAKIKISEELKVGALLALTRPDADRASKFRVAYQAAPEPDTGRRETGVEFLGVDTFWGVQFPPEKGIWT